MVQQELPKLALSATWPQWLAGVGVTLLQVQIGLMAGWSSPYIAYLTSPESYIPMTMTEASWVVSLLNLGRLFGGIIGSVFVNYFGSKTTILITSLPMALCWVCTIVANHVDWLYCARMLGGISLGMTYSCFSLYLGEVANAGIRGALVALGMSGLPIGSLLVCIMGPYLPMPITGAVSLALCIVVMVLFVWLPESPHHYVKKKLDEKAKHSIYWYHRGCNVEAEFTSLKKFVEMYNSQSFIETLKEFRSPHIKKAMLLTTVLFMFSQMCGVNNILFYMETILRSGQVTIIDPSLVVILVMIFGIGTSGVSMILIEKCGRRILMAASSFGVAIALSCLGTEFQLLSHGFEPRQVEGLAIAGVMMFHLTVFIGLLSVPSTVLGEIFPPHVKCVAACFGSILAGIFSFISTATYQPLITLLNEQFIFFFYALLLITGIPFTLFCVPETKGKSLQDIQAELIKKG